MRRTRNSATNRRTGVLVDLQHCLDALTALTNAEGGAPFRLGSADHRIKPAQPSRLFGRTAELERLAYALDATEDRCRVVLVHGYSGAGKTALVRGMYPMLSRRNGIFAGGRYDEYQRLTPFSGLTAALADLAEYWLSEAPDTLVIVREQLHAALGSNAAALMRLAPAFGLLLWPAGEPAPKYDTPSANILPRMQAALAALFQMIRVRATPLVLFIDNLQWADAGSLELFEAAAVHESTALVLLVGAYRSNEVDATHPFDAVLTHIRGSGTEVLGVVADNLGLDAVIDLVVDVLVGTPDDAPAADHAALADQRSALVPLARALHRRTEGNPFFVLKYLRRLFDARDLWPEAGRWRWNDYGVEALPGSENLVTGLLQELQHLPAEVKHFAAALPAWAERSTSTSWRRCWALRPSRSTPGCCRCCNATCCSAHARPTWSTPPAWSSCHAAASGACGFVMTACSRPPTARCTRPIARAGTSASPACCGCGRRSRRVSRRSALRLPRTMSLRSMRSCSGPSAATCSRC